MKKLRAYGYTRISRDEDRENYSSIESQMQIIKDVCEENNFELIKIIEDDGVSGYKFDREGFNELKEEIENGNVDILISKDLSRIGRHNAKTLLFLEYLEDSNVRIMVSDYDSHTDKDDIIGIKTWYNEMYVKDMSKKITDNIRSKQKTNGLVVKETYGYIKDLKDNQKLIVDEIGAFNIKKIYRLYVEGNGYRKVSDILNREGVPTPSQHVNAILNATRPESKLWNSNMIKRVLENDIYIGNLRSHKTKKKKLKGETLFVEHENQFVHENHHEAIIDKETFELVQNIISKRVKHSIRGGTHGINLFAGFMTCAECGSPMYAYNKARHTRLRYICGNYHKHGRNMCTSHTVYEDDLKQVIINQLKVTVASSLENLDNIDKSIEKNLGKKKNLDSLIRKLEVNLEQKSDEIKNYSKQLAKGLIDETMFMELTNETKSELEIIQLTLNDTLEIKKSLATDKKDAMKTIDIIEEIVKKDDITRKDLELILDMITIRQTNQEAPKGSHAQIELDVQFHNSIIPICYHNQGAVYTHWNELLIRVTTQINELLQEVV